MCLLKYNICGASRVDIMKSAAVMIAASLALALTFFSAPRFGQPSQTGDLRGRVTVSGKDEVLEDIMEGKALNRYGDHSHGSGEPVPYSLSEKAVIYVISAGKGKTYPPLDMNPRMDQSQFDVPAACSANSCRNDRRFSEQR
jgi:hypothetical protein